MPSPRANRVQLTEIAHLRRKMEWINIHRNAQERISQTELPSLLGASFNKGLIHGDCLVDGIENGPLDRRN